MSGSTIGIAFIVMIVVLGLALWLAMVARAARRPAPEHRQQDPMHGLVQGGQHVGGGRSAAPRRARARRRREPAGAEGRGCGVPRLTIRFLSDWFSFSAYPRPRPPWQACPWRILNC
jgi:hypothetical protein